MTPGVVSHIPEFVTYSSVESVAACLKMFTLELFRKNLSGTRAVVEIMSVRNSESDEKRIVNALSTNDVFY